MRTIPDSNKFVIADHNDLGTEDKCPNPKGWYHSVAGIENTPDGLVATYRLSDSHTAVYTHIMVAYSKDGGKTWSGHRSISHRNVWQHQSVWVAPQLSSLSDGRLVIICDLGKRSSGQDWPQLSRWQQRPERGMDNYLFWSADYGRTWSDPVHIDEVGGEPGYVTELSNGDLLYTRTEANRFAEMYDPPPPWNDIYYRNTSVGSTDGGKTWSVYGWVTDAPYFSDAEVGTVELEPGHVLAMTRIGFGGGKFGQPSRIVHSYDGGRTWGKPLLSPVYGQRTVVRKLQSGRLLVTFRNRWGTPASCAFVWDAEEDIGFEPSSFIWERDRCTCSDGVMHTRTASGRESEVEFSLYPAVTQDATATLEIELRRSPGPGAIVLSAGFGVKIDADRMTFARNALRRHETGNLEDAIPLTGRGIPSAEIDSSKWHTYRLERSTKACRVLVDGEVKLVTDDPSFRQRIVRFGSGGKLEADWRRATAHICNPSDYTIDWEWDAKIGYPDQFQRDRMIVLDYTSDSGYSDWTQLEDGTIVIADYVTTSFRGVNAGGPQPVLKAYLVREEDLL